MKRVGGSKLSGADRQRREGLKQGRDAFAVGHQPLTSRRVAAPLERERSIPRSTLAACCASRLGTPQRPAGAERRARRSRSVGYCDPLGGTARGAALEPSTISWWRAIEQAVGSEVRRRFGKGWMLWILPLDEPETKRASHKQETRVGNCLRLLPRLYLTVSV